MLVTCIGGPLHGQQVEVATGARIHVAVDCEPRARYIAHGRKRLPMARSGQDPSLAFFGLSTLELQAIAELIDVFEGAPASTAAAKPQEMPAVVAPHSAGPLYEVLYVSRFSAGYASEVVLEIARQANVDNPALGVTGMLLFDGFRFSQQFEAPLDVLMTLLDRIRRDVRHFDIRLLHLGPVSNRRFEEFGMGYTAVTALDVLEALGESAGAQAVISFMRLLPQKEISWEGAARFGL